MTEAPIRYTVEDRCADLRNRMEAISDVLPELKRHLPADLYGRVCAAVMVVRLPPTQADIEWAQRVARDSGLDVSTDAAARWTSDGEDDADVWVPPISDCMDSRHEPPCPHCGSATFHVRTGRCGHCGRRPGTAVPLSEDLPLSELRDRAERRQLFWDLSDKPRDLVSAIRAYDQPRCRCGKPLNTGGSHAPHCRESS